MRGASGDGRAETGRRRSWWLIIATLLGGAALIGGISGAAIYREQVSPFRATVLIVDGNAVDMEYFLKRVRLSGERPLAMLPQLAVEEMIRITAPKPPYNIVVSDADIDAALAAMAGGGESQLTDNEYAEWYRQRLNESGLTDTEYRELVRIRLLSRAMTDYLAERVPTVAEQVRLQLIVRGSPSEVSAAKARLEAGENFSDLAAELNTDADLRAKAGELGWRPRAALGSVLAHTAFDLLDVGQVGGPILVGNNQFALVRVEERTDAMQIEDNTLKSIKAKALETWVEDELKRHHIEYRGFKAGYDSETDAWVMRQLKTAGATPDTHQ